MIWPGQWRRFLDHHKMPELTVPSWIHWQKCCCYYIPTQYQPSPLGSKGWHSGESAHLPPVWPGFKSRRRCICGLSLLFVLSFALRGFSPGTPVFPSPQKPTFPNSNSTSNQVDEEPLCGRATSKSLFIYLFIYLFYLYFYFIFNLHQDFYHSILTVSPLL